MWKRGPRGRGSALERRLHDRPRSKPMRRAYVGLWELRYARALQECVLNANHLRLLRLNRVVLARRFPSTSISRQFQCQVLARNAGFTGNRIYATDGMK